MEAREFGERGSERKLFVGISVGLMLMFLAFLPPGINSIDGGSMLAVAESLVTGRGFSVPEGLGSVGRDGQVYSNWYPLLSVMALPLVLLARVASSIAHLPFSYLAAMFALAVQAPLTAATAGTTALLSLRLGATARGAWLAAVSFALGTVAMVYVRMFFAEPLLGCLTALALWLAFSMEPKKIGCAGGMTALAVLAKPTGVLVGPILTAYLIAKRAAWRIAILPACGTAAGFLVYAGYNELRFGNPLRFGQAWNFDFAAIPSGLAGLLVSPGWGLVWYCPPVILAAWGLARVAREKRLEAAAIALVFGAFLVLHSFYENWYGGWAWGPRYLLPALPGVCAVAGVLEGRGRKVLMALTAAGFLVNAPTLVSFYQRYYNELREQGVSADRGMAWQVRRAPFLHGWPAAIRELKDARHMDAKELGVERAGRSQSISESRALRIVAVWWWVLPIAGISRWIGFLAAAVMAGIGGRTLMRSTPAESE